MASHDTPWFEEHDWLTSMQQDTKQDNWLLVSLSYSINNGYGVTNNGSGATNNGSGLTKNGFDCTMIHEANPLVFNFVTS